MLLMLLMFVVSVCRSLIGRRLCPEAATKKTNKKSEEKRWKQIKKKEEMAFAELPIEAGLYKVIVG